MKHTQERVFTSGEFLHIIHLARKAFPTLKEAKKEKRFSKQMKERIMLAVTNVNGCALCSFVHSKIALKSGLSPSEIKGLLGGEKDQVSDEDLLAILFAEHFADSKEHPDKEVMHRLIGAYGEDKANLILASAIMISLTNTIGITLDLMKKRLLFKRDKRSSFLGELAILALIPYAGFNLLFGRLFPSTKKTKLVKKFVS
jgi:AhpD family alkylhydroperoxidase